MWLSADSLPLTDEQKKQLESWVEAPSTPQKIVLRARICLLAHEGLPNRRIGATTGNQSANGHSVA